MNEKRICIICGEEFTPKPKNAKVCLKEHHRKCIVCGTDFIVPRNNPSKHTCCRKCSNALANKHREQTCLERYGSTNIMHTENIIDKIKQSNLEKYGVAWTASLDGSKQKAKQTFLKHYGVDNPNKSKEIQAKTQQTNLERYGDTSILGRNSSIRKQIIQHNLEKYGTADPSNRPEALEKRQQTVNERYGGWYSQTEEWHDRVKTTNQQKYGTDWAFQSSEVQQHYKDNFVEKYGVENPMQSEELQDHLKETNQEKFGSDWHFGSQHFKTKTAETLHTKYGETVSNISQVPEIQEKIQETNLLKYGNKAYTKTQDYKNKTIQTCEERYGVMYPCQTTQCRNASASTISNTNKAFANQLENKGCKTEFEFNIKQYSYDIHVLGTNILIEIDPSYTHSVYGNTIYAHIPLEYHYSKSATATQNGYRCIHIFDCDNWNKITNYISSEPKIIGARKCEIQEIDDISIVNEFLNEFHFQNSCKGQSKCYGLYYNNKLIQLMTFGKPRYNKNYEWELLRLCTDYNYRVIGGAQKLFTRFVNDMCPSSIISYCDLAKFNGDIYPTLGFTLLRISKPSLHWSHSTKQFTDNLLRQLGADKLIGTNYGKGTDNIQIMIDNNWFAVPDCGQATYIWKEK